ncbi:hypothetical protein [Pectinatus frisingensis]|uniref:hypothetical protein n=1 Tax=Pectinatus frisingensis TaxID=865 RepID=UPI0018C4FE20|nr:hypothetical protein [Pectinatus frisingensis]
MAKVDKVMKEHVSAAKRWLGKAETSLENKNNIRGDLHIMLAEAELKCAREKMEKNGRPFWRRHVIPLAMGGLFLLLGGYWLFAGTGSTMTDQVSVPAVATATVTKPMTDKLPVSAVVSNGEKASPEGSATSDIKVESQQSAGSTEKAVSQEESIPKANLEKQTINNVEAKPQIPSKEMQQLMRTAKKTLQE